MVALGMLGTLISGQSMPAAELAAEPIGVPYISGPHAWDGTRVEIQSWTSSPRTEAPEGSIFISVKGTVGIVFPGFQAAIGRDLVAFVPHRPLSVDYFLLAIRSVASEFRAAAKGHIPGITRKTILETRVPLPHPVGQDEIVRRWLAAHEQITNLRQMTDHTVDATAVTARAAAIGAFGAKVAGADGDVLGITGTLRVGVPTGDSTWRLIRDVASMRTGHTPSRREETYWNGDIPWVGIPDASAADGGVIWETSRRTTQEGLDNSSAVLLPAQTVCMSRTASIGYVVRLGVPMATSQDFVNWVCDETQILPEWLQGLLRVERDAIRELGQGSTIRTIYFPVLREMAVHLPSVEDQRTAIDKFTLLTAQLTDVRTELAQAIDLISEAESGLEHWAISSTDVPWPTEAEADALLRGLEVWEIPRTAKSRRPSSAAQVPLLQALDARKDGYLVEELIQQTGHSEESIDEFYVELAALVDAHQATFERKTGIIRRAHATH
jgi:restriction endonuclease S subunit